MLHAATIPQIKRYSIDESSEAGLRTDIRTAIAVPANMDKTTVKFHLSMVLPTKYTDAKIKPKKYD